MYRQLLISQCESSYKLLVSHSKFSGPRIFTLRHQKFVIKEREIENRKCIQTIFFDIRGNISIQDIESLVRMYRC